MKATLINNYLELDIKKYDMKLNIEFYSDTEFRIFSPKHTTSYVIERKRKPISISYELKNNSVLIKTNSLEVKFNDDLEYEVYFLGKMFSSSKIEFNYIEKKEDLSLKEKEGHKDDSNSAYKFLIKTTLNDNDNFYGLGDKTGFLNKKYYEFINYNTDDPSIQLENMKSLYKSVNLFYVLKQNMCCAIYLDNTYKSIFNFGSNLKEYFFGSIKGEIDIYYYFHKTLSGCIKKCTKVLGRNEMPPLKALGNQQSRWSYKNIDEVNEVISGYNFYKIPLDVIHLDIDYMDSYKDFTIDNERFPNIEAYLKKLNDNERVSLVSIIDAGVKKEEGYFVYDEGIKNSYFATLDGELYVNEVWPGESVFPNFNSKKVQDWWTNKCVSLIEKGFIGIWNDMNEPASFKGPLPDDVEFKDDNGVIHYHDEIHNVYGHLMSKATSLAFKKKNLRPYVVTRAAFMGTNRYSSVWTGDNHSIYAHLQLAIPQLLNLSLCGFNFAGSDVGGFSFNCTKELLIRWIQACFMSPFLRNHSALGTAKQEPYSFDEETAHIYKKYVDLRYKLLPYIYDCFYEHYKSGAPILRPLLYNYQDDLNTYNLNDEFMIGDSILIAPIVDQGKTIRCVYLPKGKWIDFNSKKVYKGGRNYMFSVPLDETKIFIKYNSIIPMYDLYNRIQSSYDKLNLVLFGKKAKYVHYQDDLKSLDYQKGIYNKYNFSFDKDLRIKKEIKYQDEYKHIVIFDFFNDVETKVL